MSEKKEEKAVEKPVVDIEAFIARKLKAVNEMDNRAMARDLAKRLMMNKRGK